MCLRCELHLGRTSFARSPHNGDAVLLVLWQDLPLWGLYARRVLSVMAFGIPRWEGREKVASRIFRSMFEQIWLFTLCTPGDFAVVHANAAESFKIGQIKGCTKSLASDQMPGTGNSDFFLCLCVYIA